MIDVRGIAVLAFVTVGCLFILTAALGVLRMPDLFGRMQASSKAATLGTICVVIGLGIHFGTMSVAIRVGVLVVFLFITVPIAAHLIARAGYRSGASLEAGAVIDDASAHYEPRHPQEGTSDDGGSPAWNPTPLDRE